MLDTPLAVLDPVEMLPIIRKAFDEKTLQMFTAEKCGGRYLGPCAIGVCLPQEVAEVLDDDPDLGYSFDCVINRGGLAIKGEYPGVIDDFHTLQRYHDGALSSAVGNREYPDSRYDVFTQRAVDKFEAHLAKLEQKYLAKCVSS